MLARCFYINEVGNNSKRRVDIAKAKKLAKFSTSDDGSAALMHTKATPICQRH